MLGEIFLRIFKIEIIDNFVSIRKIKVKVLYVYKISILIVFKKYVYSLYNIGNYRL